MYRAFFIECSGSHWLAVGERLRMAGITPILWTGDARTTEMVAQRFNGTVAIAGVDAARNRLPAVMREWPKSPLDGPLLRALAVDESIGLSMMDRMDPDCGAFDHDSRRRHWHDLIRTWNSALDALQPEAVIFSISPHVVFDYALYALCKHRGIATRMFERTSLPGRLLLIERFEEGCRELAIALRSRVHDGSQPQSPAAVRQLKGLREGGVAALPPNYQKKLEERGLLVAGGRQAALGLWQRLSFEARRIAHVALRKQLAPPNYLMMKDSHGMLSSPSASEWLQARLKGQTRKRHLRQLLTKLARQPDPSTPFVLLALHYQPERAIVPLAGSLGDQTLIADMLARALPPNWQLVIKEHPWQLAEMGRGELGRSSDFYRRLADRPNVVICPPDTDTTDLLDRSQAIATATGSIGWQAVARGKTALVFGAAWYRGCPGTYSIDSFESCKEAIAAIECGAKPPSFAAEALLAAVEDVSIAGFLEPELEAIEGIEEAQAVAEMSRSLELSLLKKQLLISYRT